jgi:hypothetical protein
MSGECDSSGVPGRAGCPYDHAGLVAVIQPLSIEVFDGPSQGSSFLATPALSDCHPVRMAVPAMTRQVWVSSVSERPHEKGMRC